MHRLFVGLRPPPAMRQTLLACMGGIPDARWQDDEQLHLTLRFIGEVDGRVAEDIAHELRSIAGPQPSVAIDGVGTFDRRGIVHTVWARVVADPALMRLQKRIDRLLAGSAEPGQRAFTPHITLARLNRAAQDVHGFIARNASLHTSPALLDGFALYESILGRGGATYHAIARYPLGSGGLHRTADAQTPAG